MIFALLAVITGLSFALTVGDLFHGPGDLVLLVFILVTAALLYGTIAAAP